MNSKILLAFTALAGMISVACAEQLPTELKVSHKPFDMTYTGAGAEIRMFDMLGTYKSSILMAPALWDPQHFYLAQDKQRLIADSKVEKSDAMTTVTIDHTLDAKFHNPFKGKETFVLRSDNALSGMIDYSFRQPDVTTPTQYFDWSLGAFQPMYFVDSPFEVEFMDGTTTSGILPNENSSDPARRSSGNPDNVVAANVKKMTIHSPLGKIVVTSIPDATKGFQLSYRREKWATSPPSYFWFGFLDKTPIPCGETVANKVGFTMQFPDKLGTAVTKGALKADAKVNSVKNAMEPLGKPNIVVPAPKEYKDLDKFLPLQESFKLTMPSCERDEALEAGLKLLEKDLAHKWGLELELTEKNAHAVLKLGKGKHPQGYTITPGADGKELVIEAKTTDGLLNGIRTLVQLIYAKPDQGVVLQMVKINDWPAMEMRGVHCLTGKNSGEQLSKMIRELMARFKMNTLIFECQYIKWDSQPSIHHGRYGMDKSDARKVVESAAANHVEIVPLIHSLGHSEWIFTNDQNLDLAEDPNKPYCYSPSVPRTYEFIFSVYQEALDFFKPRIFHIGHDEFTIRGRFPYRSEGLGDETDLYTSDILRLHAWFKERGVQTMMWGDQFLLKNDAVDASLAPTREDANRRLKIVPKDMIIADWHYAGADVKTLRKSLEIFKKNGFKALACGWYTFDNIRNFAKAAAETGSLGYIQTTWAGFNFKVDGNESFWSQYWSYIWAAHYSWTGDGILCSDGDFITTPSCKWHARDRFLDEWFERVPAKETKDGFTLDITKSFNAPLLHPTLGVPELKLTTGTHNLSGVKFEIAENNQGKGLVILTGCMNPAKVDGKVMEYPESVAWTIKPTPLAELHLLMTATARGLDGSEAGTVEIADEKGKVIGELPLVYGKNLFAFDDYRQSLTTWQTWRGKSGVSHVPVALWDVVWKASKDEDNVRKAAKITVKSKGLACAPVILGVTGFSNR